MSFIFILFYFSENLIKRWFYNFSRSIAGSHRRMARRTSSYDGRTCEWATSCIYPTTKPSRRIFCCWSRRKRRASATSKPATSTARRAWSGGRWCKASTVYSRASRPASLSANWKLIRRRRRFIASTARWCIRLACGFRFPPTTYYWGRVA